MASSDEGARDLTEIKGDLTSVANIWLMLTSVGIDFGARAERYGGRNRLLARDRRLLEIFFRGPCLFRIFGLVLTSVEDVDAPYRSTGEEMPCG